MSSAKENSFVKLLKATTASSLFDAKKQVITINANDDPVDGFKKIITSKVLSAPVFDEEEKKYIGFLDTRDLVRFAVAEYNEVASLRQKRSPRSPHPPSSPRDHYRKMFGSAAKLLDVSVDELSTRFLAAKNKFHHVKANATLYEVIEHMTAEDNPAHRVAVLADDGTTVTAILTQSNVMNFMYANRLKLKDILSPCVSDVKLGTSPVLSINARRPAIEALKRMSENRFSGMAIVDNDGRFMGNVSGSDLRLFIQDPANLKHLNQTVIDFTSAVRQATFEPNEKSPTIGVHRKDSILKALGRLCATKVHRVYVADDESNYKPSTVISITDLLRYALQCE